MLQTNLHFCVNRRNLQASEALRWGPNTSHFKALQEIYIYKKEEMGNLCQCFKTLRITRSLAKIARRCINYPGINSDAKAIRWKSPSLEETMSMYRYIPHPLQKKQYVAINELFMSILVWKNVNIWSRRLIICDIFQYFTSSEVLQLTF